MGMANDRIQPGLWRLHTGSGIGRHRSISLSAPKFKPDRNGSAFPSTTPFTIMMSATEIAKISLLKHAGYQAVRFDYEVVRPDLEDILDLPCQQAQGAPCPPSTTADLDAPEPFATIGAISLSRKNFQKLLAIQSRPLCAWWLGWRPI
jgi:hypothetical protein